jgi:YgiT-type zinc finger domain-containing protein
MKVTCAVCDSDKVKKVRRTFEVRYHQTPVMIEGAERYRCEACGEEFFTPEQSSEVSRQIRNSLFVWSALDAL